MLHPDFTAMPAELRRVPRWVVWKGAKLPYRADVVNSMASVIDPGTWGTFEQAQTAYEEGGYLGVGFVLAGDGIVGVDLDKCVEGGKPKPAAMGLMDRVGCRYVELSPSGTGLRGFGYGDNISGRRGRLDDINIELYASRRYLTVTGRPILSGPLVPLGGFADVANSIRPADLQKRLKQSSVFFCLFCRYFHSTRNLAYPRGPAQPLPVRTGPIRKGRQPASDAPGAARPRCTLA
jgi:primase-polymerase (primpol)-like protein